MSTSTATLLPTGTWQIDPSHSSLEFSVRHLGLAKVKGRFSEFAGDILVTERAEDSRVDVTIQAASIDTRDAKRDAHLTAPDFLDVENHPSLSYRTTALRGEGGSWKVDGDLTILGQTRPVQLDVTFEGTAADPWGGTRAAFSATAEIDREDWGMTYNLALEAGGFLVGKKVKLELEIEAVLQAS